MLSIIKIIKKNFFIKQTFFYHRIIQKHKLNFEYATKWNFKMDFDCTKVSSAFDTI